MDVTVRTPNSVTIPPLSNSTDPPAQLILRKDAKVYVYTISAKAGLIVYFGGL